MISSAMINSLVCGAKEIIDESRYKEIGIYTAKNSNMQSPFYLAVLDSTTVAALKKRISGVIKVSKRRIILLYCGEILEDNYVLSEEMFELKTLRTFEDNLFQPKGIHIYVCIYKYTYISMYLNICVVIT
jgi:hypothetical protein